MNAASKSLLASMRVLDLTDERGYLCGRMLADLGADVIKIERPGGDAGRRSGPFYRDNFHPEKSLYWFAYNANKRGITLDVETDDGKELFKRLLRKADAVVESFEPGYMDSIGLGYEPLSRINPRLILTSISAFGQKGPYAHFKSSDITLMAMGGYMNTCGDPDRPPLRIGFPQAYLFGGAEAAVGTLIAYYHQQATGEGQHVDISAQHSITWTAGGVAFWVLLGTILSRVGQYRVGLTSYAKQRLLWPCKDGWVTFQIWGGKFGAKSNEALMEWMDSEGFSNDYLRSVDWKNFDMAQATQEVMDRIEEPIGRFFMAHARAELEEGMLKRDVVFYPVYDMEDVYNSPQLQGRDFWTQVEHPELDAAVTYPGGWAKFSGYEMGVRRAPLIGEHNAEIYEGELGLSGSEVAGLRQAGAI